MNIEEFLLRPTDDTEEPFFWGSYPDRHFDSKNRIIVPPRFHETLQEDPRIAEGVALVDLEDHLAIIGSTSWRLYLDYFRKNREELSAPFATSTRYSSIDEQRRITIPRPLKEKVFGDNDTIDFVGMGGCIMVSGHEYDIER
jgi:DNA-binding transcriptional regulator/RsmH inhibitor MraZ